MSYIAQDGEWDRLVRRRPDQRQEAGDGRRKRRSCLPPGSRACGRTPGAPTRPICSSCATTWASAHCGQPRRPPVLRKKLDVAPYTWLEQITHGAGDSLAFIASSSADPHSNRHLGEWTIPRGALQRVRRDRSRGAADLPAPHLAGAGRFRRARLVFPACLAPIYQ